VYVHVCMCVCACVCTCVHVCACACMRVCTTSAPWVGYRVSSPSFLPFLPAMGSHILLAEARTWAVEKLPSTSSSRVRKATWPGTRSSSCAARYRTRPEWPESGCRTGEGLACMCGRVVRCVWVLLQCTRVFALSSLFAGLRAAPMCACGAGRCTVLCWLMCVVSLSVALCSCCLKVQVCRRAPTSLWEA